jgi:hypothetical protein
MASMDSVHQKFYRTKIHFEELNRELKVYYESSPASFIVDQDNPTRGIFKETQPVPARIGLIAGDCLQSMRSSLDYLVWELILANGTREPDRHNAFPIALTEEGYRDDLKKRHRLRGVPDEAAAIIDSFQPYRVDIEKRDGNFLAVLDYLVNINKHRRVLLTGLGAVYGPTDIVPLSYLESHVTVHSDAGELYGRRFISFVSFKESKAVKGLEIAGFIDTLARYVRNEVLPLFEKFFAAGGVGVGGGSGAGLCGVSRWTGEVKRSSLD